MYQPIPLLTLEEYLALDAASEHKWEYEDGRVYCLAGSTNDHAAIVSSLNTALDLAIGKRPCRILTESPKVIVSARKHYYPDLVVSCDERERGKDAVVHYPLLVAEVLSPSTEQRDKGSKLFAYQQVASIENILLIAAGERMAIVYERVPGNPREWISRQYDTASPDIQFSGLNISLSLPDLYRRTSLVLESGQETEA
jgi:Uma2 family endonuclease